MTRTKQQELEQAQNLHLIRDERILNWRTGPGAGPTPDFSWAACCWQRSAISREIPPGPSFWPSRC